MKKSIKIDLADTCDALEHLETLLGNMTLAEKVDVGARMRGVMKNAEKIDKVVKEAVTANLNGKEGTVIGETFKAVLDIVEVNRLDQKLLKEEKPKIVEQYTKPQDQNRITYAPR